MPALSLVRGWSIAILLSFFPLSLAQSSGAVVANSVTASAVYIQTNLQTAYSGSWPLTNRSSESYTWIATQTVSPPPIRHSTAASNASSVAGPTVISVATSLGQYTTSSVLSSSASAISAAYSSSIQTGSPSIPAASTTQIAASFSPLPASARSTSTSQVAASSSPVPVSASSTSTTSSNNATSTTSPFPASVNGFSLVGCVASVNGYEGFLLWENTTTMSIGRCALDCIDFAYAGTFDR
jgi:hypothetical protein